MNELSRSQSTPVQVETPIGTLSLFPQRFQDIGAFSKLPLDEPSSSRLRSYMPYMAERRGPGIEDGESTRVDEAMIQQLSDEDLERIAEAYLSMAEMREVAQGASPSSGTAARADGESATVYLDRLLRADHERKMEDLRGTYEILGDKSREPFSSALDDVDRQASSLRDVATGLMQGHNFAEQGLRSDLDSRMPSSSLEGAPSWSGRDAHTEDDRLKRARDEEIMLTRSIGIVTTQSAILVASLSEAATQFLRQFSDTTQKSDQASLRSMRMVLVAVLLVGLLAMIAAAATIASYVEARENRQMTNQWRESMLQSMNEAAAAQAAQVNALESQIRELTERQIGLASSSPPLGPAADAAAQKATGDAEAPIQALPKPAVSKRPSKRKVSRT
jgi:hypothetical protein